MRHPFLLLALLAGAASAPAESVMFDPRPEPDPLPPDPNLPRFRHGGKIRLMTSPQPAPNHQGRECTHPGCGLVVGPDVRICAGAFGDGRRAVKTRKVTLDYRGRPVRRRR